MIRIIDSNYERSCRRSTSIRIRRCFRRINENRRTTQQKKTQDDDRKRILCVCVFDIQIQLFVVFCVFISLRLRFGRRKKSEFLLLFLLLLMMMLVDLFLNRHFFHVACVHRSTAFFLWLAFFVRRRLLILSMPHLPPHIKCVRLILILILVRISLVLILILIRF